MDMCIICLTNDNSTNKMTYCHVCDCLLCNNCKNKLNKLYIHSNDTCSICNYAKIRDKYSLDFLLYLTHLDIYRKRYFDSPYTLYKKCDCLDLKDFTDIVNMYYDEILVNKINIVHQHFSQPMKFNPNSLTANSLTANLITSDYDYSYNNPDPNRTRNIIVLSAHMQNNTPMQNIYKIYDRNILMMLKKAQINKKNKL